MAKRLPTPVVCVCRSITSGDEADGRQQSRLRVVHLDGQELVGEGEHQLCQRAEASVVHLCAVQRETVRERHCVLVRGVTCADTQYLESKHQITVTIDQTAYYRSASLLSILLK